MELAVSHGKLNEGTKVRHLSELNDPTYKYFRQNNNPLDVVYREKAKFDVKNPIIGDLLKEINKGKLSEDEYFKKMETAPNIKDLDIKERFDKLFERDTRKKDNFLNQSNNNDGNDSPPGSPSAPPPPPMHFDFDSPDEDNNPLNINLNNLEREYFARDIPIEEKTIQLDTNLQEIFPDADEILYSGPESREKQKWFPYSGIIKGSKKQERHRQRVQNTEPEEIPAELQFFNGGIEQADILYDRFGSQGLVKDNEQFIEFLATGECQEALQRDGISIHIPTGDIFVNNQNEKPDFFYDTGRFPGRNTLIHVPMADMPSFINSNDWISPRSLYETYLGRDMQGITSVQFLAAFNRFLGGDREVSRNAMSEFFHNLSWQALTNDNDSVKIKFEAITELVNSINSLLQQKIYDAKKRALVTNYNIQKKLLEK